MLILGLENNQNGHGERLKRATTWARHQIMTQTKEHIMCVRKYRALVQNAITISISKYIEAFWNLVNWDFVNSNL